MTGAILPRWWNVSPLELHAIALYQRTGEELLAGSSKDEALRGKVLAILSNRWLPPQLRKVEEGLRTGRVSEIVSQMMPADNFYLAAEFRQKYPDQAGVGGTASQELDDLCRQHPDQANWNRLARDFGAPHPSMAQNYGLELINMVPMPRSRDTPTASWRN